MRVIICGSRNWTDRDTIEDYIKTLPPNSTVIHGACRGADIIAHNLALKHGHRINDFPAEWGIYGFAAGPIRNGEMLKYGDPEFVVAFHDDLENSKGTKDMVRQARAAGVPVEVRSSNKSAESLTYSGTREEKNDTTN